MAMSCGPQGLNITGKCTKHFDPHPLSLAPLSCSSPGCFSPGPTCCPLKTIGSLARKALVLSRITDSLKSQYFMRFGPGRQIEFAVKNVNSIIFYTIFYLKGWCFGVKNTRVLKPLVLIESDSIPAVQVEYWDNFYELPQSWYFRFNM